jgi:hypothetical protein
LNTAAAAPTPAPSAPCSRPASSSNMAAHATSAAPASDRLPPCSASSCGMRAWKLRRACRRQVEGGGGEVSNL